MDVVWILFLALCGVRVAQGGKAMTYIRTEGELNITSDGGPNPVRCFVSDCLAKCQRVSGCYCARMGTGAPYSTCDVFSPRIESNLMNHTGYIYYAADRYKDTINKGSIAVKKYAHQSSTYVLKDVLYSADRANDGSRNVDAFAPPYISHTSDSDSKNNRFPWWQVDLKEDYVVTGVAVLNRLLWSDRLHDFEVRVGSQKLKSEFNDKHFQSNALCAQHFGPGIAENETKLFLCHPCPIRGRYISIQIVRFCTECSEGGNDKNVLQLAEVDVFGFKAEK